MKPYSFYFWKSAIDLSTNEQIILKNTSNIYIKYFDIKWNEKPQPVAKIDFKNTHFTNQIITPVIYITNEVFIKIPENDIDLLADKVLQLIDKINQVNDIEKSLEIQIDCDWSESSQIKYFLFLSFLKKKSQRIISTTIRLHQVKYVNRTGIPPCDKGVLMFYNMGKLGNFNRKSIYNEEDAQLYVKFVENYPLKLEIALPIFGWGIVSRNHRIVNLLAKIDDKLLQNPNIKFLKRNHYRIKDGLFLGGIYFQKDDEIFIEKIDKKDLFQATKQVSEYIKKPARVIFFDLDSTNISLFSHEEFSKISSFFN